MRRLHWRILVIGAAMAGVKAEAATVAVTITAQSEIGYELNISGIRKNGRLGPQPGPATVRDLIDVGMRERAEATLTFIGSAGVIATCPEVHVPLAMAQALCEPAFVLTSALSGLDRFRCLSRCDPRKRGEKERRTEGEDDEETTVATRPSDSEAQPRRDGWAPRPGNTASFQSFYNAAMSGPGAGLLYSAPIDHD